MKKVLIICTVIIAGAAVLFLLPSKKPGIQTNSTSAPVTAAATIEMKDDGYSPREVTIKKGEAVTFKNVSNHSRWPASNIHPTHDIYPEFDPKGAVEPGESWTFTFEQAGVWRMHDHITADITGTVTVTE